MCRVTSRAWAALGGHLSEVCIISSFMCCVAVNSCSFFPFFLLHLLAFKCSNSKFSEGCSQPTQVHRIILGAT